jgi:hypothetical protein
MGRRNGPPYRSVETGNDLSAVILGSEMTKKLGARLYYALVISVVLLMTGFLGLGVRAFATTAISDFIYFGALGILLMILAIYFIRRGSLADAETDRKFWRFSAAKRVRVQPPAPGRRERRRPLLPGQTRAAIAFERRSRQLGGFRPINPDLFANGTLRR